jgi:hypothetical protein
LLLPNLPGYALTELSPVSGTAGSGSFQLTATGDGFTAQSVIDFNGTALPTTFVSATSLRATASAGALNCGGGVPVTVSDPTLGSTNTLTFSSVGAACDFSFGATVPASNTVTAGGTASYQLALNAVGNTGGSVQLSCSSPPAGFTCDFTPNPATTAAAVSNVTLTISVPATATLPVARFTRPRMLKMESARLAFAAMLAIFILFTASRKMPRARTAFAFASVVVLLGLMAACGGGGGGGTGPVPKTYEITIQGVVGNFQHSTTVQLVVD